MTDFGYHKLITMTTNSRQTDQSTTTSIAVSAPVRDTLFELKNPGDSYDDVLRREFDVDDE